MEWIRKRKLVPGHHSRERRVAGVDGLRALAAGSVLVFHAYYYAASRRSGLVDLLLRDCALGVTLFFTLSGFLLFRPYARAALTGARRPSLRRYARNRVLRILPAYWVVLGAATFCIGVYDLSDHAYQWSTSPSPLHVLASALLVQNYFPATFATGLPHAWSLAVEVVFYGLIPLIGAGVIGAARHVVSVRSRTAVILAAPLALLCLGLVGKSITLSVSLGGIFGIADRGAAAMSARSFLGQADQFSFGMIVAVIDVLVVCERVRLPRWWTSAIVAAIAVLLVPTLTLGNAALTADQRNTAAALLFSGVLALVVLPGPVRPHLLRVLERRLFVAAGLLSYSVFLWHNQIAMWLAVHRISVAHALGLTPDTLVGIRSVPLHIALIAVPSLALAWLTYRLVELPALSLRRRGGAPTRAGVPAEQSAGAPLASAQVGS